MKPIVSVIVCTRNRAKLLDTTLISLLNQDYDSTCYEIIVVDNGSKDGTRDLVGLYSKKTVKPLIRYVYEEHLGSSWARNAGWQAARGSYIAYLDDDESAEQSWLRLLMSGFEGHSASIAAVGGAVILDWGGKRPNWLPAGLEKFYSGVDFGPNARILTNEEYPLTANLAVRRNLIEGLGGFQTALGHVGNMPSGGEDVDLIRRIRTSGAEIFYKPKAVVYHHIPKARQRRWWILKRCYAGGTSQPILDGLKSVKARDIFYNLRAAVSNLLKALFFLINNQDIAFVEYSGMSMLRLGRATALIQMSLKDFFTEQISCSMKIRK